MRSASVQPCVERAGKGRAHLGREQRVVEPALGLVDVELGRHDVEVAGQHDRQRRSRAARRHARSAARTSAACSRTSGPAPGCRWAGRGSRSGRRSTAASMIAAVAVVGIAGQAAPGLDRICAARRGWRRRSSSSARARSRRSRASRIAASGNFSSGAFSSCRQTTSGCGLCQPAQQHRQPAVDAVDVVGGDLHAPTTRVAGGGVPADSKSSLSLDSGAAAASTLRRAK